jgi:predicted secreted protein
MGNDCGGTGGEGKLKKYVMIILLLAIFILSGCSNTGDTEVTDLISPWTDIPAYGESAEIIDTEVHEYFALGLPSNPRLGFSWKIDISGEFVEVIDNEFESGGGDDDYSGRAWFLFKAVDTGTATLQCTYQHGTEGPAEEQIAITVKVASD